MTEKKGKKATTTTPHAHQCLSTFNINPLSTMSHDRGFTAPARWATIVAHFESPAERLHRSFIDLKLTNQRLATTSGVSFLSKICHLRDHWWSICRFFEKWATWMMTKILCRTQVTSRLMKLTPMMQLQVNTLSFLLLFEQERFWIRSKWL